MAYQVTGEDYMQIDGQLHELKRQLRQKTGYPHNPKLLSEMLQRAIDGDFGKLWTELAGVISFTLKPAGIYPPDWIARLRRKNVFVSDNVARLLSSRQNTKVFAPTLKSHNVRILKKSRTLVLDKEWEAISKEAVGLNLGGTHPEVICLLCEMLTAKDMEQMGLQWVCGDHAPLKSEGRPDGDYYLHFGRHEGRMYIDIGATSEDSGDDIGVAFNHRDDG